MAETQSCNDCHGIAGQGIAVAAGLLAVTPPSPTLPIIACGSQSRIQIRYLAGRLLVASFESQSGLVRLVELGNQVDAGREQRVDVRQHRSTFTEPGVGVP